VNKLAQQKFDLERFNLKKFNNIEVKEKYQVGTSNRFAATESLGKSSDINSAWKSTGKNIKGSAKETLGYHRLEDIKSWFDDECSKLTDQQKQVKLQWLQNPSQINGDNLQNLRCKTRRTCRKNKREHLKDKISKLETNKKHKSIRNLYRGINEFKRDCKPEINTIIKDEYSNLLGDQQSVLIRWKNFFNQVLNVHGVHDVRQMDACTQLSH
jgi:hypothetical protein